MKLILLLLTTSLLQLPFQILKASDNLLKEEEINAFRSDLELTKKQMMQQTEVSLPDSVERRLKKLAAFEAQNPSLQNKSKVQSIPGATFSEEEVLAMENEANESEADSDQVSLTLSGIKKSSDKAETEQVKSAESPRRSPRLRSR